MRPAWQPPTMSVTSKCCPSTMALYQVCAMRLPAIGQCCCGSGPHIDRRAAVSGQRSGSSPENIQTRSRSLDSVPRTTLITPRSSLRTTTSATRSRSCGIRALRHGGTSVCKPTLLWCSYTPTSAALATSSSASVVTSSSKSWSRSRTSADAVRRALVPRYLPAAWGQNHHLTFGACRYEVAFRDLNIEHHRVGIKLLWIVIVSHLGE